MPVGDAICSAEECASALHGDKSQTGVNKNNTKTFSQSQDCPCITGFPGEDTQFHSRDLLTLQVSFPEGEKMFPHRLISHQPLKARLDARI